MGFCVVCGENWTAKSLCHCTSCHRTFGGLTGFDMHRKDGKCLDPQDLGMKITEAGIWIRDLGGKWPNLLAARPKRKVSFKRRVKIAVEQQSQEKEAS
jgi:hypothetical protein